MGSTGNGGRVGEGRLQQVFCGRVEDVTGGLDLKERWGSTVSLFPWLEWPMCSQGALNLISKELKDMLYIMRNTYLFPVHKKKMVPNYRLVSFCSYFKDERCQ